jgi:hypothetical protein
MYRAASDLPQVATDSVCMSACRLDFLLPCRVCADVECTDTVLPVTYPKFADMMEPGDTLYVGRYLVSGADQASLYLEVRPYFFIAAVCSLLLVLLCTLRCMVGQQQGGNPPES